jgi:phosphoglucomutase
METMAKVMAKVRGMSITEIAGEEVLYVADYLSGAVKYANGSIGYTGLPESNVIYLGLEDEQFICIRPSGTEPQLKIYVLVYADTKEKSQAKADKLMAAVKEMLQ